MPTFAQLSARLKNFLRGWFLVLGLKEDLVECATVCVKSVVILLSRDFQWTCATDQTAPKQFSIPLNKLRWTIWCSSTFFVYYAYVFVTFLARVTVFIFSFTAHCNLKVVTGYFHEIDHRPSVMAILVMEFSREGYKIRKVFG